MGGNNQTIKLQLQIRHGGPSALKYIYSAPHRHCPDGLLPANNHHRLGFGASSSAVNHSSHNLIISTILLVCSYLHTQEKTSVCKPAPPPPPPSLPTQHRYLSRIRNLCHTFSIVHMFHHWCRCCLVNEERHDSNNRFWFDIIIF